MPPLFGSDITSGPDILQFMQDVAEADLYGITCAGKTDGGGAQAIANMSVQLFCKLTGKPYFHTPFRHVRFARGDKEWDAKWETFFNLGHGEKRPPEDIPVLSTPEYLEQGRPTGVILALPHCHNYIQNVYTADAYTQMRDSFREKYWASDKDHFEKLIPHKDYLALHIRRGDVSSAENQGRYTDSETIIDTVTKFKKEIGFEGEIHVFSQGDPAEFAFLECFEDVKYFIDTDIFETMHRIANAKAIVCAKSAVSLLAGMLGNAPVMTEVWYHRPLDEWYTMSSLGIPAQQGFLKGLKETETKVFALLGDRTAASEQEIVDIITSDERHLRFSSKLMWAYAQILIRRRDDKAYELLEALVKTDTPQANAARKTIESHIKMGIYYREEG